MIGGTRMTKLKMPVVKANDNGTFNLNPSNGWHSIINIPRTPRPGLTTVMRNDEDQSELVIMVSRLDEDGDAHFLLGIAGEGTYHHQIYIGENQDGESFEAHELLTKAVNAGLKVLQELYDDDHIEN